MATKTAKTTTTTTKGKTVAAPKKVAAKKAAPVARGPKALLAKLGTKEAVVSKLMAPLARDGEDADALRGRLMKASNAQLLRLSSVVETVTRKFGSRAKLMSAIAAAHKADKDKQFAAKLATLPLARLLDMSRRS
jgi:hypothetical protein